MFCAGLTGGIGSGKSTVAQILQSAGAALIDADEISRASTASGGSAIEAIERVFGTAVLTAKRALDRAAMRELILRDPQAKARLEQIIHPLVSQHIEQRRRAYAVQGYRLCVMDIPLLTEGAARWRNQLNAVWVVDCLETTQTLRVSQRNSWPLEQIQAVQALQARRAERRAIADVVWFNEGIDLEQLRSQVLPVVRQFGL